MFLASNPIASNVDERKDVSTYGDENVLVYAGIGGRHSRGIG